MAAANRVAFSTVGGSLKKRVTIITVEQERIIEIHWQGQRRESLCQQCGAEVRMLTPDEAAGLIGVSPPTVCDWAETGRLHFTKTSDGLLLVCLNSLSRLPIGRLIAG
jgi:excisionase family DNA binding protein